eukprot:960305-Rhodomonas_salina.1
MQYLLGPPGSAYSLPWPRCSLPGSAIACVSTADRVAFCTERAASLYQALVGSALVSENFCVCASVYLSL